MLPAHKSKHFQSLAVPFNGVHFRLAQSDDGITNGTGLWLGAQILSVYLASTDNGTAGRALELGSGIGLSAYEISEQSPASTQKKYLRLVLASMGWNVIATDLPGVIAAVLDTNISQNSANLTGNVHVAELDWTWDVDRVTTAVKLPFDMIISADTVYSPDIIQPLLRTIHAVSVSSAPRRPLIYLAVERRDPALIDRALSEARETWGFRVERVPHKKLVKAMAKAALHWDREDWDGVEIWKLVPPKV